MKMSINMSLEKSWQLSKNIIKFYNVKTELLSQGVCINEGEGDEIIISLNYPENMQQRDSMILNISCLKFCKILQNFNKICEDIGLTEVMCQSGEIKSVNQCTNTNQ